MTEEEIKDLVRLAATHEWNTQVLLIEELRKQVEGLNRTIEELNWREQIYIGMVNWLCHKSNVSDEEHRNLLHHMRNSVEHRMPTHMLEDLLHYRKQKEVV